MKDYSLLVNPVYLYILEHENEKINYSKIAIELSLTRQTVAKYYQEIQEKEPLDITILNFHDELKENKYMRALAILRDIDKNNYSMLDLVKILSVSKATLEKYSSWMKVNYYRNNDELEIVNTSEKIELPSAVYGCFYDGQLIYIGSTYNFEERIACHYNSIKACEDKALARYLKNKDLDKVQFIPFIRGLQKNQYQTLEKNLIRTLHPICNVEFQ